MKRSVRYDRQAFAIDKITTESNSQTRFHPLVCQSVIKRENAVGSPHRHNARDRERERNTMGEGDPIDIKWIMTQVLVRQQATRNRTKSFDWGGTDHIDKTDFAPSAAIDS